MHNSNKFLDDTPNPFDQAGGDPLSGSGFETESPEPDFTPTELTQLERQAPAQE